MFVKFSQITARFDLDGERFAVGGNEYSERHNQKKKQRKKDRMRHDFSFYYTPVKPFI